jgi:hypothetical protein
MYSYSFRPHATALKASWHYSKQPVARQSSLPKDTISSPACSTGVLFRIMRFRKPLNCSLMVRSESINSIKVFKRQRMIRWWYCIHPARLACLNQLFSPTHGWHRLINRRASNPGMVLLHFTRLSKPRPSSAPYLLSMWVALQLRHSRTRAILTYT